MKLRLFVGIDAPEHWKQSLAAWRGEVEPRFTKSFARWTPHANLHLTLRFFGAVEEARAPAIVDALRLVTEKRSAFELRGDTLGCFPNPSRPRILWLGLAGQSNDLVDLESSIRTATASFGQAPENRPFHPHL